MKWLYRLGIFCIRGLLPIVGLFNKTIGHFLEGRKGLFEKLDEFRAGNTHPIAWFHVASLGEYEQAKPVIEALKSAKPELQIALSFFSPSGYDQLAKKPSDQIDFLTYLPLDSKQQARRFVNTLNPTLVFFVKYDLWYHHIQAVKQLGASLYLVAASFRSDQVYFSNLTFFQNLVKSFDTIFTQDEKSIKLLESIGYSKGMLTGDTRFDRVIATAKSPKQFPAFLPWAAGSKVLVAGSVWDEDMQLLIPEINSNPDYRWIIAPHSQDPDPMKAWISQLTPKSKLFSQWDKSDLEPSVLFIDNIGMLSSLYQFGRVAYVGGAFGKGLHNILEPIGFGIPVLFGKLRKMDKFPESARSRAAGCGFEVATVAELKQTLAILEDTQAYSESKRAASQWLEANSGAAERIVVEVLKSAQS